MFNKTTAARAAMKSKSGERTIYRWAEASLRASVVALACLAFAGPALASSAFDGDWSVVIVTRGGDCDPSLRYAVTITDGAVLNGGGSPVDVRGQVTRSGAVQVSVQAGNQWASGSGRLGRNSGGGVWRGQGSAGACEGTWIAQRRTDGVAAEAPGRPVYNYAPRNSWHQDSWH